MKPWLMGALLCGALAGCMKDESAEAVAMGQFKSACKEGNLSACTAILQREEQTRASNAAASAAMLGSGTATTTATASGY